MSAVGIRPEFRCRAEAMHPWQAVHVWIWREQRWKTLQPRGNYGPGKPPRGLVVPVRTVHVRTLIDGAVRSRTC